jgi:hypothetical protein
MTESTMFILVAQKMSTRFVFILGVLLLVFSQEHQCKLLWVVALYFFHFDFASVARSPFVNKPDHEVSSRLNTYDTTIISREIPNQQVRSSSLLEISASNLYMKKPSSSISLQTNNFPNLYMQLITGTSSSGFNDGAALSGQIKGTMLYVDLNGNIYIADDLNARIRKISSGIISTIGGSSTQSSTGGSGPIASMNFYAPYSIVGDLAATYFYMADQRFIWKYSFATGIITSLDTISSSLYVPLGLWLTTSGNLYITDKGNCRIAKLTPGGILSSTVGSFGSCGSIGDTGPALSAQLSSPMSVYLDTNGKIFVADYNNNKIRMVNTNNIITTFAGTGTGTYNGDNLPAVSTNIYRPNDVKGDSAGNIYIADSLIYIRIVDSSGILWNLIGNGVSGFTSGLSSATSSIKFQTEFGLILLRMFM